MGVAPGTTRLEFVRPSFVTAQRCAIVYVAALVGALVGCDTNESPTALLDSGQTQLSFEQAELVLRTGEGVSVDLADGIRLHVSAESELRRLISVGEYTVVANMGVRPRHFDYGGPDAPTGGIRGGYDPRAVAHYGIGRVRGALYMEAEASFESCEHLMRFVGRTRATTYVLDGDLLIGADIPQEGLMSVDVFRVKPPVDLNRLSCDSPPNLILAPGHEGMHGE